MAAFDDVKLAPMAGDEVLCELNGVGVDVAYAIRQLREFGDKDRALDALDRVWESLMRIRGF